MYIRYIIPLVLLILVVPGTAVSITERPDTIANGYPIYITITDLPDDSRFDLFIDSSFEIQPNSEFAIQMSQFAMPFDLDDGTIAASLDGTSTNRLEVRKGDTIVAFSGKSVDGHYSTTKGYDINRGTYDYFRLSGVSLPTTNEVQAKLQVSGIKQGPDDSEITFIVEGMPGGTITLVALVDGSQALYKTVTLSGTTSSDGSGGPAATATATPTPTVTQGWKDFTSADGKARVRAFGIEFVGLVAVSPQDVPEGMRVVAGPYSVMPVDLAFDPAADLSIGVPAGIAIEDLGVYEYSGGKWVSMPVELADGELHVSISAPGIYALLGPVPPATTVTETETATAAPATTVPTTTAPSKIGMEMLTIIASAAASLCIAARRR
jgi:hypothetical protein